MCARVKGRDAKIGEFGKVVALFAMLTLTVSLFNYGRGRGIPPTGPRPRGIVRDFCRT